MNESGALLSSMHFSSTGKCLKSTRVCGKGQTDTRYCYCCCHIIIVHATTHDVCGSMQLGIKYIVHLCHLWLGAESHYTKVRLYNCSKKLLAIIFLTI